MAEKYFKRRCPTCDGAGRVLNIWDWNNWIPFTAPARPFQNCGTCRGKGIVWQKWVPKYYRGR